MNTFVPYYVLQFFFLFLKYTKFCVSFAGIYAHISWRAAITSF